MSKNREKDPVVRASDLALPKQPTQKYFRDICYIFRIPADARQKFRERLDSLVSETAKDMRNGRIPQNRKAERESLKRVCSQLGKIETELQRLGPFARLAHISITPYIAPMVSWTWLREKVPMANHVTPIRAVDGVGLKIFDARHAVIERRSIDAACSIFHELKAGYGAALSAIKQQRGAKGGRQPLDYRRYFIINLALLWRETGKEVSGGPKSDFVPFVQQVIEAIGWPPHGVAAEVPKALRHLRRHLHHPQG
jgi:histone H3/H4